jgi:hypothetical protein
MKTHDWDILFIEKHPEIIEPGIKWECSNCKLNFTQNHKENPSLKTAVKKAKISNKCNPENPMDLKEWILFDIVMPDDNSRVLTFNSNTKEIRWIQMDNFVIAGVVFGVTHWFPKWEGLVPHPICRYCRKLCYDLSVNHFIVPHLIGFKFYAVCQKHREAGEKIVITAGGVRT